LTDGDYDDAEEIIIVDNSEDSGDYDDAEEIIIVDNSEDSSPNEPPGFKKSDSGDDFMIDIYDLVSSDSNGLACSLPKSYASAVRCT